WVLEQRRGTIGVRTQQSVRMSGNAPSALPACPRRAACT
ncbi:MAG: hypothetical protein JWP22_2595, partial [Ramlibacter sp.]|nr:hypothetical protein [Ramlibacter sp.]